MPSDGEHLSPQHLYRLLTRWGYVNRRQTGSHLIMQHPERSGSIVTIDPGMPSSTHVGRRVVKNAAGHVGVSVSEFMAGPPPKQRPQPHPISDQFCVRFTPHDIVSEPVTIAATLTPLSTELSTQTGAPRVTEPTTTPTIDVDRNHDPGYRHRRTMEMSKVLMIDPTAFIDPETAAGLYEQELASDGEVTPKHLSAWFTRRLASGEVERSSEKTRGGYCQYRATASYWQWLVTRRWLPEDFRVMVRDVSLKQVVGDMTDPPPIDSASDFETNITAIQNGVLERVTEQNKASVVANPSIVFSPPLPTNSLVVLSRVDDAIPRARLRWSRVRVQAMDAIGKLSHHG